MNDGSFRFNVWLYNEMKKRQLDSFDLEALSGVSKSSIEAYLKCRQYPTLRSFEMILDALGKKFIITEKVNENGKYV